jgi:hypothetical protein
MLTASAAATVCAYVFHQQQYHAKGKMGMGKVKWSHLNVQLREIDFDTRIAKSKVSHIANVLLLCQ